MEKMNERYQYRLWNKIEKSYNYRYIFDLTEDAVELWEYLVIEEYTGINDKNNTKIYQGDILKIKFNKEERLRFVDFEKGCYGVKTKNSELIDFMYLKDELYINLEINAEVIGNIHENPELLEKCE